MLIFIIFLILELKSKSLSRKMANLSIFKTKMIYCTHKVLMQILKVILKINNILQNLRKHQLKTENQLQAINLNKKEVRLKNQVFQLQLVLWSNLKIPPSKANKELEEVNQLCYLKTKFCWTKNYLKLSWLHATRHCMKNISTISNSLRVFMIIVIEFFTIICV